MKFSYNVVKKCIWLKSNRKSEDLTKYLFTLFCMSKIGFSILVLIENVCFDD